MAVAASILESVDGREQKIFSSSEAKDIYKRETFLKWDSTERKRAGKKFVRRNPTIEKKGWDSCGVHNEVSKMAEKRFPRDFSWDGEIDCNLTDCQKLMVEIQMQRRPFCQDTRTRGKSDYKHFCFYLFHPMGHFLSFGQM